MMSSIYNIEKLTLFLRTLTISFVDLISNYDGFLKNGYIKNFCIKSSHDACYAFLFLMTGLASIFTMNSRTIDILDYFNWLLTCLIHFILKTYLYFWDKQVKYQ